MTIYFLSKITNQGAEDKQDAGDDVCLDGCESLGLGDVGGDGVEDVDEDEEHGDEESHPAGHILRGDEEADPGHQHEHGRGQVPRDQVVGDLPPQHHLKPGHRIHVFGQKKILYRIPKQHFFNACLLHSKGRISDCPVAPLFPRNNQERIL